MLEQIRRLLRSLEEPGRRPTLADDPRVAAAALLVHVAEADGAFTQAEGDRLRALLQREFGIGEAEAADLLAKGRRADAEAIDLYGFTSVLMSRMDETARISFVEVVWSLIYADGDVHELEDNLAWRIAELLGVSSADRMSLKREASRRAGLAGSTA